MLCYLTEGLNTVIDPQAEAPSYYLNQSSLTTNQMVTKTFSQFM